MSESRESSWLRISGIAGIVTPVIAFTFIGLAIASYSQFRWVDNALSDLGVVTGFTATLFNIGLYLSGLLSMGFAFGLYNFLNKHVTGKAGAVVFFAAGLALEGIGVAPENVRPFHYIFSVAFFTLTPIALLVITAYFFIERQKLLAEFTLLIAVFAALEWVVYFQTRYVPGVAIPELLSGLALAAWAVVIGWKMAQSASRRKTA